MTNSILTKGDVKKAAVTWFFTSHLTYNYQRLQAGALATLMGPVLNKLYKGDNAKISEGLERHMLFFNSEPRIGSIIPGISVALEEGMATEEGENVDHTLVTNIKTALMGPLAGIGDTLWSGLLKQIVLSIFLGWALLGNIWAPIACAILLFSLDFTITYKLFLRGYEFGMESVEKFLDSNFVKNITSALGIVGLICLGAMIVKYVSINTVLKIELETGTLNLRSLLDKLIPYIIPLSATILGFWLQVKGKSINMVLLVLFVLGFIGGATGVLG